MSKLDAATPQRITKDWAMAFPEFDVWRVRRLLRRIGPVVQGITLDLSRSGEEYFPTTHVHALTREFPMISLTLSHRLAGSSGAQERISRVRHDVAFRDAARRLAEQSELSLLDSPAIEQIIRAYHAYVMEWKDRIPRVNEMEDSVLVSAVVGRGDLVEESLDLAAQFATVWNKASLPLEGRLPCRRRMSTSEAAPARLPQGHPYKRTGQFQVVPAGSLMVLKRLLVAIHRIRVARCHSS